MPHLPATHRVTVVVFALAAALVLAPDPSIASDDPAAQPEQAQSLKKLTLEQLMEIDVTSAARRPERVVETGAAVSVITGEDIRRSGAGTLPDALRLAGMLSVARFNGGTWAISARGFTNNVANKMLVLIDGRSVYTPLFGGTFWDMQDLVLADVNRIEVLRGPAGTLWGSNAVNGVINIITKSASETQGGLMRLTAGTRELGSGALRYGGRIGDGAYRVYAKTGYWDSPKLSTGEDAHQDRRLHQAGFRADWGERAPSALTVQGDLSYGRMGLLNRPDLDYWSGNLLGRWQRRFGASSALQVQGYIDRMHRQVPQQSWEDRTTYDIEAQHDTVFGERHRVVWGGGYRLSKARTEDTPLLFFDPARRSIFTSNLFVEDEIALRPDRLFLGLGSKFEHTTFTGWEVQPNARVRFRLTDRRMIWAAVSRAVRTPTQFDQDLRISIGGVTAIRGDRAFVSEKLVAYEAGYRHQAGSRLTFGVSAFVNQYDDLRSQEPTPPFGVPIVLMNKLNATSRGLEVGVTAQPTEKWLLRTSYAFVDVDRSLDADSLDLTEGSAEGNDPKHQVSLRSYFTLGRGVELDGFFRAISALPNPAVPAYAELDLRLGWRDERLDLSLIGRDLLHGRHPEFGPAAPSRHEFQREFLARAILLF